MNSVGGELRGNGLLDNPAIRPNNACFFNHLCLVMSQMRALHMSTALSVIPQATGAQAQGTHRFIVFAVSQVARSNLQGIIVLHEVY